MPGSRQSATCLENSFRSPSADSRVRVPWFLVIYLGAITIFGKGPTYLGIPPLYWGEIVMFLGLFRIAPWLQGTGYLRQANSLTVGIIAYMTLGAILAAFSLQRWRLDALRDSA